MQQALRKFRQLQQADNHVGQIPGIGRASGIVGTQPDFTLFCRLMQQVLNEIAAVFAVYPRCPDHHRIRFRSQCQQLSGQFRAGIHAFRIGRVYLGIRDAAATAKYIIG